MDAQDYFQTARQNEPVFRAILLDLKNPAGKPLMVEMLVPRDLDTKSDIEELFEKYSRGERTRNFTISDFTRPSQDRARITIQNTAPLSGGGIELEYAVSKDNSVEYLNNVHLWMH